MSTGTNKERLEQNNAKIEELISLVKTKGYQTIEVLPVAFIQGEWYGIVTEGDVSSEVVVNIIDDTNITLTLEAEGEEITLTSTYIIDKLTISATFGEAMMSVSFVYNPTDNTLFSAELNATFSRKTTTASKLPQVIDRSITELTAEDFGDITVIGDYVFSGCEKLTSVEIPNNVTILRSYSFSNCRSLPSINIPSSITDIHGYVFNNCVSLKKVYIENLNDYMSINFSNTSSCPLYHGASLYINNELTINLVIPDNITVVNANTFCGGQFETINLNQVVSIGIGAFSSIKNLTQLNIPKSIETIQTTAFQSCLSLETVIFEGQVPNILNNAFKGCNSVTLYDFSNCTSVPTLANVASLGHASGCVIRVPASLYDEWTTATNWSALTDVVWEKVGGVELISFYIDETPVGDSLALYQAEEGMTWGEWVNSLYNTKNADFGTYIEQSNGMISYYTHAVTKDNTFESCVKATDYIDSEYSYILYQVAE